MMPNFLVIGANKAGTSALYRHLMAHPQIFMSAIKEPSYFALTGDARAQSRPDAEFTSKMVATREAYEALFDDVTDEKAVGEASTAYLRGRLAPERIHRELPHAKLVAILRDPADRARSAHAMYVAKGFEPLTSLNAAIDEELKGSGWRKYVQGGFYSESLSRYVELFPREQLKVFLYEEFRDEPLRVLRDLFTWLDVDPTFQPDVSRRYNDYSTAPKTMARRLLDATAPVAPAIKAVVPSGIRTSVRRRARQPAQSRPAAMPTETRRRLVELYRDDIEKVAALTGRDLSAWLTV